MSIRNIPLVTLDVNRANDRHGELENETAAIAWLLHEREQHMRNLTKDIVQKGEIYEYPLVFQQGERFIVYDGNRRVTCLKLLADSRRAPTTELQEFFEQQRSLWQKSFPEFIDCQVETNRDRIDEILFRRHTGTQNGVGQSTWDDRMKSTFVLRTGKGGGTNVAQEIEKRLHNANLLQSRRKVPWSTLNRLLSAEAFRQRAGFSVKGGKFHFVADEDQSLKALAHITTDLSNRNIVLGDLWDYADKMKYLDRLAADGILPTQVPSPKSNADTKSALIPNKVIPTAKVAPTTRSTLIPQTNFNLDWPGHLQRHHQIWEELQFHLDLRKHTNAVAILMRVLLELSLDNYIRQKSVVVYENDKLAARLEKACTQLEKEDSIDRKQLAAVKKFRQNEQIVSADTMNRYVHSSTFSPSPEHLMAIWDSLSDIIVKFLQA